MRWQSPSAREWLGTYLGADGNLPPVALAWLAQGSTQGSAQALPVVADGRRLSLSRLSGDSHGTTLLVRKHASAPSPQTLGATYGLTSRESEVLYWVACGKINRDVGDILGMSPRTVDKHLQHVFEKLHVETRTAAVSMVLNHAASDR